MKKLPRDMIKNSFFRDHSQNFWQMAFIQAASVSLTGSALGGQFMTEFNPPTILISIACGNLFLWVVGMAMISMSFSGRSNAITNVIKYFGKISGFVASIILILAFIIWYVIQVEFAASIFNDIFSGYHKVEDFGLKAGVICSLLITVVAIGGIRCIKWICVAGFPIILCFIIFIFLDFEKTVSFEGKWGIAWSIVFSAVAATLVGMINIPTFFKHSRSKSDSFLALTLITVFTTLIEASSIWLRYDIITAKLSHFLLNEFNFYFFSLFILVSLICINLVNIYFASAGLETILSRVLLKSSSPAIIYILIGLAGTATFAFVGISSSMVLLVNIAACFLANLGIVLALAFLVNILVKHKKRLFEKHINNACWFIGCISSLVMQVHYPENPGLAFISGIGASMFAFLIAGFLGETLWSINELKIENMLEEDRQDRIP